MAPAGDPRGPSASYGYFARPASTLARHSTHSGQPLSPYRWVGWPQPAHGPTWAGGHTGAGGRLLGWHEGVHPGIVRTRDLRPCPEP
jgi:hypothetical protein